MWCHKCCHTHKVVTPPEQYCIFITDINKMNGDRACIWLNYSLLRKSVKSHPDKLTLSLQRHGNLFSIMRYQQPSPGHEYGQQYRQPETEGQRIQPEPCTHRQLKRTAGLSETPVREQSRCPDKTGPYYWLNCCFSPLICVLLVSIQKKKPRRISSRYRAFLNQWFT